MILTIVEKYAMRLMNLANIGNTHPSNLRLH
nr:MAG TPA: hypothetical protein [Caudoviricetes sp.]